MTREDGYRSLNWILAGTGGMTFIMWVTRPELWLWKAGFFLFAVVVIARVIATQMSAVGPGEFAVVDDEKVVEGPGDVWSREVQYIQPDERVFVFGPHIVKWIPDIRTKHSTLTFARKGMDSRVTEDFQKLLTANPNIDLREFQTTYGIKILSQSGKLPDDEKNEDLIVLGHSVETKKPVSLPYGSRNKHIFVLGKTGTGKSTLMLNMIRQDMELGKGLAVVEPGDLVRGTGKNPGVIHYVPAARHADVVYYDFEHPVPIDVFETKSEEERETLAEDIITTFRRFFESSQWGMGMDTILRFTVLALAQYPPATFLDIYKFLADESFRAQVLGTNANPTISHFWQKEFPKNPAFKSSVTGINSRMAKFVTSSILQATLGTKSGAIDFQDLLQKKKILLVNVRGGEAGSVIGSLIVSKIQQTAMRRRNTERVPFYLFADEFQNYTTSAFNVIFTEARKYELGMTLATQLLTNVPTTIRDNIMQAATAITFRSDEGSVFKNRLGNYDPKDVARLNDHHAIVMAGKPYTGEIQTAIPPPPSSPGFKPTAIKVSATLKPNISPQEPSSDFDDDIRPSPEPMT